MTALGLRSRLPLAAFLLLSSGNLACAGARTTVVAPDAVVPVSMSRAVLDENGEIVTRDRRTVVGTYRAERYAFSLGWSLLPLNAKTDLSKSLNEQVAEARGDAVINLKVTLGHCPLNGFFLPFGALPIWPGCAQVDVTGDIVKVAPAGPHPSVSAPLVPPEDASPPAPRPPPSVQIAGVDERQDEWLHDHCTFVGLLTAGDRATARREAERRLANVIEPMSIGVTWASGSTGTAKLFACPQVAAGSLRVP